MSASCIPEHHTTASLSAGEVRNSSPATTDSNRVMPRRPPSATMSTAFTACSSRFVACRVRSRRPGTNERAVQKNGTTGRRKPVSARCTHSRLFAQSASTKSSDSSPTRSAAPYSRNAIAAKAAAIAA